jgi:hypothetical protein
MKQILLGVVLTPVIFLLISIGLVVSQRPSGAAQSGAGGLDFTQTLARKEVAALPMVRTKARDGAELLSGFVKGPEGAPLLVLVHGSGWHGAQLITLPTCCRLMLMFLR